MQTYFHCGRFKLELERPLVMGIVNVTPDSFSDGGRYLQLEQALQKIEQLISDGADIIDIGGESTRPGAASVSVDVELSRVMPVIEAARAFNVPLSIDTCKTAVMQAALQAGVDMVNDIAGLEAPGAIAALAQSQAGICLMHKQGNPQTMQAAPHYQDVVSEVSSYLVDRISAVIGAGVAKERILADLGFGFGKNLEHNRALFRSISILIEELQTPMLVGVSRKRMLGELTGREVGDRTTASVTAALLAVQAGAQIVRVHDVRETLDALKVWQGLK
ncbi:dihydropteroate synthase [Chitinibacter sp. SCUT-21]|uniref:dihydropteroate synthase n=1 Tax=Chitinibacter sp. SCUT-21 TaxID=2970891 RepID=UPI0035A5C932